MAKLVFGMNQSLDAYVDHEPFAPDPALFATEHLNSNWLQSVVADDPFSLPTRDRQHP